MWRHFSSADAFFLSMRIVSTSSLYLHHKPTEHHCHPHTVLQRNYYVLITAVLSLMPVLRCRLHGSSVLPANLFNMAFSVIFKCYNHLRLLSLSYKRQCSILNHFPSIGGRTQQEMQLKGQRVSESG